jgi:3-polyprenyl-4-hydroxybenzoate decarboxylase
VIHAKVGKNLKNRLLFYCAAMHGGGLKPLIIGNAACPTAFKMNNVKLDDLPVIWRWRYNRKVWMISEIFSEWMNEVNRKMKRANQ